MELNRTASFRIDAVRRAAVQRMLGSAVRGSVTACLTAWREHTSRARRLRLLVSAIMPSVAVILYRWWHWELSPARVVFSCGYLFPYS